MEYHAIEDAESWHGIQDILEEKVREGVEVRVFYDDMGSIGFITTDFVKRLEEKGIRARVFNPFAPGLNLFLNNRDHRKITVIDGKVGFTGGYNLANEYFHVGEPPYGFWKDTGIRLEGDAVRSLTVTFLENWNAMDRKDKRYDSDFAKYLPKTGYVAKERAFVQPYADSPMDGERVGEEAYISLVNKANRYCWFATPYLILTDEMIHALGLAAKRGVDVRLVTPGIPDKKIVYRLTRSYYTPLLQQGVRIYEYTPGFLHAKCLVTDDEKAVVGSINLDFRSLYLHFECGTLLYRTESVPSVKQDMFDTFAKSREVFLSDRKQGFIVSLIDATLRVFSPLL
jgi:cardiolipin synthase